MQINLNGSILEEMIYGAIAALIGFWFWKFCAKKFLKWYELKDEIIKTTVEFGHFYSIPIPTAEGVNLTTKDLYDRVQQKLREMAGEVETLENTPLYVVWTKLRILPSNKTIKGVKSSLIGWSNSLVKGEQDWGSVRRELYIEQVKKHLNKPNSYKELKEIKRLEIENAKNH